jgi:transposase
LPVLAGLLASRLANKPTVSGEAGDGGRPPQFDAEIYKQRNVVERAINKLKGYRAVASRYDKRDCMYRGTIDVASIRIWLRDPVP